MAHTAGAPSPQGTGDKGVQGENRILKPSAPAKYGAKSGVEDAEIPMVNDEGGQQRSGAGSGAGSAGSDGAAPVPAGDRVPPLEALAERIWLLLRPTWMFLRAMVRRFLFDDGPQIAASLTYTSLLSVVPLLALSLAIITIIPAFDALRGELREMFMRNFLPDSVAAIDQYLDTFTRNAGQLTAAGLVGLVVTSVLLFITIEDAFNRIWRVKHNRSVVVRLMAFWTLMSLGPLLFGASVSVSGSVADAVDSAGGLGLEEFRRLTVLGPVLLTFLGFSGLYWMLPNYPVRWQHALIGGAVATGLFEILKMGFGFYVQSMPSFQIIYGALSIIPILLIWTYLAWCVAVIGALVAALLPNFGMFSSMPDEEERSHRRLEVAILVLDELRRCAHTGAVLKLPRLVRRAGLAQEILDEVVGRLEASHIVLRRGRQGLVLSRDLRHLRLYDLAAALHLLPGLTWREMPRAGRSGWATDLQARMLAARRGAQEALAIDLDAFLTQERQEPAQESPRNVRTLSP